MPAMPPDLRAELEAARRRLEAFAHGVSHDLRAPLRAIEGFAAQVERHATLDEEGRDALARIRGATVRMAGLIERLSELAQAGRAELRPRQVDLGLLAEWAAAELQDAQPQREARVDVQPGLEMIGDERLLKAMLSQLLRNAWQFAREDAPVQVEVTGERFADGLRLCVRDAGIGFDMAFVDKLFLPFQRLHGAAEGAGPGIGLAVVRQVAERHGGRAWAVSGPEPGACFHVELHDLDADAHGRTGVAA